MIALALIIYNAIQQSFRKFLDLVFGRRAGFAKFFAAHPGGAALAACVFRPGGFAQFGLRRQDGIQVCQSLGVVHEGVANIADPSGEIWRAQ